MLCTPLTPLGSARAYPLVDASAVDSSLGNVFAEQSAATSGLASTQLPGEIELAARNLNGLMHRPQPPQMLPPRVLLAQPRNGQADDLKKIKGVGPKLETILNTLGVFHFDQIMAWGPDDITWMDENLNGFKGRVSRDDWVAQAKALAP